MVAKTIFSEDDLIQILAGYNLGTYQSSRPISAGTVQTNHYIETTQGAYVLKYYESRPYESVQFEADVVQHIHRQGFPCPAAYANKDGVIVNRFNENPYIIFEFVDGEPVKEYSPQQRTQVAQVAAQLQTITEGYRPDATPHRWNYTPELCLRLAHEKASELNNDMAHAKVRWYEREVGRLQLPDTLPKGVCHGDYDVSNVFFKDDKLVTLLDFDDANYTFSNFDLIALIDGLAWPFGGDFNPAAARQIAHDYMSVRPLSEIEKRHLFDVHKLQIFIDGLWFFARGAVDDFYEKQKVEYLDSFGRDAYYDALFSEAIP